MTRTIGRAPGAVRGTLRGTLRGAVRGTARAARGLGAAGLLALALGAALGAAGCHPRPSTDGEALYADLCASCHGPRGRGQNLARPGGSLAPEQEGWIAPALDQRGHCFAHSRAQLIAIVRDGSAQKGSTMLAFRDKLSDEQIGAVVSYLETLWDGPTRRQYAARSGSTTARGAVPHPAGADRP
jgi:mono/diheme cytochrome c family protein